MMRVFLGALSFLIVLRACPAVLTNRLAQVELDGSGSLAVVRETESGRVLVDRRSPFLLLKDTSGLEIKPTGFSSGPSTLQWRFAAGEAVLGVRDLGDGWRLTVEKLSVPGVGSFELRVSNVMCRTFHGTLANMISDAESGICLRAYSVDDVMSVRDGVLSVAFAVNGSIIGKSAGLVVAPRSFLQRALQKMTLDAGVPHSATGGAWALGSEKNRHSYLMTDGFTVSDLDKWMEMAKLAGIRTLHFNNWWETLGNYEPSRKQFPNGRADFAEMVKRLREEGLGAGAHTLTGCISFTDPWVTPETPPDLMKSATYTLASDLDENASEEIRIREPPIGSHDTVLTYDGNGNILQVGTEMIQYAGVRREGPDYAFTGLTRGAFGTTRKPHAAGEKVHYLWQHFMSLFAEPGTPLARKLATRLGEIFGGHDMDFVYFDGADGLRPEWKRNQLIRDNYSAICKQGGSPVYEDSMWTSHAWWFHSRIGGWDPCSWGPKVFVDRHFRSVLPMAREANLLEPQMGWWAPIIVSVKNATFPEDVHEYFIGKCAGYDTAWSFKTWRFGSVSSTPLSEFEERTFVKMGWYERFRLARAFTDEAVSRLRKFGSEFRLGQDAKGCWTLTPVRYLAHRVGEASERDWMLAFGHPRKVSLKVEALYGTEDVDRASGPKLFGESDFGNVRVSASGEGVASANPVVTAGAHGPSVKLSAANDGDSSKGAWAQYRCEFAQERNLGDYWQSALSVWVKGDGSGALLNIQPANARVYGRSYCENFVKLDFVGWRRKVFLLRERDLAEMDRHKWPYSEEPSSYALFHNEFRQDHFGELNFYLNEIPPKSSCTVEVGEIQSLAVTQPKCLRGARVTVNDVSYEVPFDLSGGEFAELRDGIWTRYDYFCNAQERMKAAETERQILSAGRMNLSFDGRTSEGALARAVVTVVPECNSFPALKTLSAMQKSQLSYEPDMPRVYAPSRGFSEMADLLVRPGETAMAEVTVTGPLTAPFVICVGSFTKAYHENVPAKCRVKLETSIGPFSGRAQVSLRSASPQSDFGMLSIAKKYGK